MTFPSIIYGVFLLSVCGIFWSVQQDWLRLWTLLIASVIFYSSLNAAQYVPLLFAIALINFCLGLYIGRKERRSPDSPEVSEDDTLTERDRDLAAPRDRAAEFSQQDWNWRRLAVLIFGIFLNVVLLLGFKYVPFILTSIGTLLDLPAATENANRISDNIIAPLGLSFFCFENIAYLIDVYRGAPASREFLKFSAYKLFFPKLIAGPITRYHQLASQLKTLQFPSVEVVAEGLWLIAFGSLKKALIADRLGIFVDLSFDNLVRAGSGDLWLAIFAYGLQIYLDFSGYVDIVRGSAMLLGLTLPDNFDYSYFTTSIADFWRRWHITLGDWLRNYLYFPLGGSRRGLGTTCRNLLIVMLIAGIWHGASWGFIVWGLLHGMALVVHRITSILSEGISDLKDYWKSFSGVILAWMLTQGVVFSSWIFFRLPNLQDSGWVIQHLWGHSADVQFAEKLYLDTMGLDRLQLTVLLWFLVGLMLLIFTIHRGLKLQLNWPLKLLLVPACLYAVWHLAPQGSLPYIYFDF